VTKIFSLILLLLCSIANSPEIQLDSITYSTIEFKKSSELSLLAFDLGQIASTTESQRLKLHVTDKSESSIFIENIITVDDIVGSKPEIPILPGKSDFIKFNFLAANIGNRELTLADLRKTGKINPLEQQNIAKQISTLA